MEMLEIIGYFLVDTGVIEKIRNIKIIAFTTIAFGILLFISDKFKSDKKIERISNNHPLKRTGVTDDISSLINFLISDDSNWITGQNISIDGVMSTIKQ